LPDEHPLSIRSFYRKQAYPFMDIKCSLSKHVASKGSGSKDRSAVKKKPKSNTCTFTPSLWDRCKAYAMGIEGGF
jgi:hypothetical protein